MFFSYSSRTSSLSLVRPEYLISLVRPKYFHHIWSVQNISFLWSVWNLSISMVCPEHLISLVHPGISHFSDPSIISHFFVLSGISHSSGLSRIPHLSGSSGISHFFWPHPKYLISLASSRIFHFLLPRPECPISLAPSVTLVHPFFIDILVASKQRTHFIMALPEGSSLNQNWRYNSNLRMGECPHILNRVSPSYKLFPLKGKIGGLPIFNYHSSQTCENFFFRTLKAKGN